jgi:hypothetical protein
MNHKQIDIARRVATHDGEKEIRVLLVAPFSCVAPFIAFMSLCSSMFVASSSWCVLFAILLLCGGCESSRNPGEYNVGLKTFYPGTMIGHIISRGGVDEKNHVTIGVSLVASRETEIFPSEVVSVHVFELHQANGEIAGLGFDGPRSAFAGKSNPGRRLDQEEIRSAILQLKVPNEYLVEMESQKSLVLILVFSVTDKDGLTDFHRLIVW